ncbi:MAG: hypothetical protein H6739_23045 [Alphaproteobacteria bacterium]|nr:hypothetical protein [Alphaproteobacteria bacterium]
MRRIRLLAPAVLALLALPVAAPHAQDAPPAPAAPAPEAPTSAGVELLTDLRAEYILGEAMLVRFTIDNTTSEPRSFADLSSRPWLVRFELTYPNGKTQAWYTSPPEVDPNTRWSLVPRGQRRVLLEIPSSERLAAGDYSLVIKIQDDTREIVLPAHSLRIAPANPVGGEIVSEIGGVERSGHQVVWLHKAKEGYDLYLHHADGKDPRRQLGDYQLLHLDTRVDPVLAQARPQDRWDRHIYWATDSQSVAYVRLQGQGQGLAQDKPRVFRAPYPTVELIGRGSTDANGGLHVPMWVPAPKGAAGELRVASVRERVGPRFRQVVRMDHRPDWVETVVDGSGNLRMLVAHDGNVDLYSLDSVTELPAVGKRLLKAEEGATPWIGTFGYLPAKGESSGGLAALILSRTGDTVEGRWLSLEGMELHRFPGQLVSPGMRPIDLLPRGYDGFGLLVGGEGGVLYLEPGEQPMGLGQQADAALVASKDGTRMLRRLVSGGPVEHKVLRP